MTRPKCECMKYSVRNTIEGAISVECAFRNVTTNNIYSMRIRRKNLCRIYHRRLCPCLKLSRLSCYREHFHLRHNKYRVSSRRLIKVWRRRSLMQTRPMKSLSLSWCSKTCCSKNSGEVSVLHKLRQSSWVFEMLTATNRSSWLVVLLTMMKTNMALKMSGSLFRHRWHTTVKMWG